MKRRSDVDPELHILRTLASLTEGRDRQALESARFNLYAAFEHSQPAEARRWAKAVRAALLLLNLEGNRAGESARRLGFDALDTIDRAIDSP
jgi:hypothetical protein